MAERLHRHFYHGDVPAKQARAYMRRTSAATRELLSILPVPTIGHSSLGMERVPDSTSNLSLPRTVDGAGYILTRRTRDGSPDHRSLSAIPRKGWTAGRGPDHRLASACRERSRPFRHRPDVQGAESPEPLEPRCPAHLCRQGTGSRTLNSRSGPGVAGGTPPSRRGTYRHHRSPSGLRE